MIMNLEKPKQMTSRMWNNIDSLDDILITVLRRFFDREERDPKNPSSKSPLTQELQQFPTQNNINRQKPNIHKLDLLHSFQETKLAQLSIRLLYRTQITIKQSHPSQP